MNTWRRRSLVAGTCLSLAVQVVLHPSAARAATDYYVDSVGGSDANSGTGLGSAWQTLAKIAGAILQPGDTVHFARGSTWTAGAVFAWSGTASAYITLIAYTPAGGATAPPTLNNTTPVGTGPTPYGNGLEVTGSYVKIDGLAFKHDAAIASFTDAAYRSSGALMIPASADHDVVQNSEFTGVDIGLKLYGQHALITHNYFHDLVMGYNGADQSYGAIGVSVNNSYNEIAYNRFINCRNPSQAYGYDGGAIELEGYDVANKTDISIHHNYSSASQGFLEVTETTSTNVTLAYNYSDDYQEFVAWDNTDVPGGYLAVNNTVICTHPENASDLFTQYRYNGTNPTPDASWLTYRNNIFYITNGGRVSPLFNWPHDHNLAYSSTASDPLGQPIGWGDILADPQFVNYAARDLHLQPTSAAINAGVAAGYALDLEGNPVPSGLAPDLGAYEYDALKDGSFEGQTSPSVAPPWATAGSYEGIDLAQGKARSGQNNGWVASTGGGFSDLEQTFPVTPSSTYLATCYVNSSANFSDGSIGARTGGATRSSKTFPGTSGYTQEMVSFNSGSNTAATLHIG